LFRERDIDPFVDQTLPDRPIRIAQQLSAQRNEIGAVVADDLVRLGQLGDQADGDRRHLASGFNRFRKRDLIAREQFDRGFQQSAAADVEYVDRFLDLVDDADGFFQIDTAFEVVRRR